MISNYVCCSELTAKNTEGYIGWFETFFKVNELLRVLNLVKRIASNSVNKSRVTCTILMLYIVVFAEN